MPGYFLNTQADAHAIRDEHIQIAGVPERHEPDTGEVNYGYLFRLLDQLGYEGWIGCEYRPADGTVEGLGWMKTL
jgi:hydroxypyruvate isomerase